MTAPTIETDLGKILERIDQKLDGIREDVTEIKVGQARLEERMTAVEGEVKGLKDEIKDLKASQRNQIWALIGILGTVALGAVIRMMKFLNALIKTENADNVKQRIMQQAFALFEDEAETQRWLSTPKDGLDGQTPLEALATDAGSKKVEELLYRAEYGIFG